MSLATDVINAVRTADKTYFSGRIAEVTETNLNNVIQDLTSNPDLMNKFIKTMVNVIGLNDFENKRFNNPFERFRKSSVPFGDKVAETYIAPSESIGYDRDGTKLLKQYDPTSATVYYALCREDSYPVSINPIYLAECLHNEQKLSELINLITASLYNGDSIDEFTICKNVIGKVVDDGAIPTITGCKISATYTAHDLLKDMAKVVSGFKFPSTGWNGYNKVNSVTTLKTWSDDIVIFMRNDVKVDIDFDELANMFNISVADIMNKVFIVDDFGDKNDTMVVVADRNALKLRDKYLVLKRFENGATIEDTYFLHHIEYIYFSMFANACAFIGGEFTA